MSSSGYVDDSDALGPTNRNKFRKTPSQGTNDNEEDNFVPPSQRRYRKLKDIDPYKFPMLPTPSSTKDEKKTMTKPAFSGEGYAALGRFLKAAPQVIAERKREQGNKPNSSKKVKGGTRTGSKDVDPWSFPMTQAPTKEFNMAEHKARRQKLLEQVDESDEGEEEEVEVQPKKGKVKQAKAKAASKKEHMVSKPASLHKTPIPSVASQQDFMGGMFAEQEEEAAGVERPLVDEEPIVEPEPPSAATGKKNKKQLRQEAKARKAAEQAAAKEAKAKSEQMRAKSRTQSPSASVKVNGWDIDPHSKPASNASGSHRSRVSAAPVEEDAWEGADMGGMFEEDKKSSSHRSHRSAHSNAKSALSFPIGDAAPESGSQRRSRSGSGSKKSGSRREGSKTSAAVNPLETIVEDEPLVGGWGEERVWEPPKSGSANASSHRSHRSAAPEPVEPSHHSSRRSAVHEEVERSHHSSRRSAKSAEVERSHRSSRHSSHRSRKSHPPDAPPASQIRGSIVSAYHPPTVEDVPDAWSASNELKPPSHKSRSRTSSSHRTKSSYEQNIDDLGAVAPPASYRSHRSGRKADVEPQTYTSKSAEKVNEWFENVPPPSAKALSQGLFQVGSRQSSRRSFEPGGWDDGLVPPDASVGTGYEINPKRRGERERRASLGSRRGQAGGGADAWEKRTSSGSSTRADLGVRQVSQVSGASRRSRRESLGQGGGVQEENNGGW